MRPPEATPEPVTDAVVRDSAAVGAAGRDSIAEAQREAAGRTRLRGRYKRPHGRTRSRGRSERPHGRIRSRGRTRGRTTGFDREGRASRSRAAGLAGGGAARLVDRGRPTRLIGQHRVAAASGPSARLGGISRIRSRLRAPRRRRLTLVLGHRCEPRWRRTLLPVIRAGTRRELAASHLNYLVRADGRVEDPANPRPPPATRLSTRRTCGRPASFLLPRAARPGARSPSGSCAKSHFSCGSLRPLHPAAGGCDPPSDR